jgi:hypothetical protein
MTGVEIQRVYVDKRYKGHDAPKSLRIYRFRQKHGVLASLRRNSGGIGLNGALRMAS